MIDPAGVGEILEQYKKHGWSLRRALLSDAGRAALAEAIGPVEIETSDLDALWFTRKSRPGTETWELRRLTALPFALVAVISNDATDDEVESTLTQVIDEMREKTFA